MRPITNPLLPPKTGYVEVIDDNGRHVYKPTRETEEKLKQQEEARAMSDRLYDEMAAAYQEGVTQA